MARPFAFNPGGNIAGTIQVGDLTIGNPTAGFAAHPSIKFWNGPSETGRIITCSPDPAGNHFGASLSGPETGEPAFIGFQEFADSAALIAWTESVTGITPLSANNAKSLLTNYGIWTSYEPVTEAGLGVVSIRLEFRATTVSLMSFLWNVARNEEELYGIFGTENPNNNPVPYLPTDGPFISPTYHNVAITVNPSQPVVGYQFNYAYSYNGLINGGKYHTYYVNGILMSDPEPLYTTTGISGSFTKSGGLTDGDEIVCIIRDIPGFAPLVE